VISFIQVDFEVKFLYISYQNVHYLIFFSITNQLQNS